MPKKIEAKEVNKALEDLDSEIKTVEGLFNLGTIYNYIKQQNQIINSRKQINNS